MSGPENLKGFDYQITYSLLKTLEELKNDSNNVSFKFESIDELEEDFNICKNSANEFYQLKKRCEGNHWTPSDFKLIFEKFIGKDTDSTKFVFVSDGTANSDVKKLKSTEIEKIDLLTKDFLSLFLADNITLTQLKNILKKTTILTRFCTSDDDNDPAKNLKKLVMEVLSQPPFKLLVSIDSCYTDIWKMVFDYAREAKRIEIQTIKDDFKDCGLTIETKSWLRFPDISNFQGRKDEVDEVSSLLQETNILLIYGINGIGKTWVTSKLIEKINSKPICWVNTDRWTSIDDFLFYVSSCLYNVGYPLEALKLQKLEITDRIPVIADILRIVMLTIIIDSLNSGNEDFYSFIECLLQHLLNIDLAGKFIITSTKKIKGYSEIDIVCRKLSEYQLNGFTLSDTREILSSKNNTLSVDDIDEFHNVLGGNPMAVSYLKQLISKENLNEEELTNLKKKSIESSRDWIIEKSIVRLSQNSQNILMKLSILEGNISDIEISYIINSDFNSKYLLKELYENHLIYYRDDNILIHDSIKDIAQHLLSNTAKLELHKKLMDYYNTTMKTQRDEGKGLLYSLIMKWGYHAESLKGTSLIPPELETILNLTNEEIDALWGIDRYGYPYDFNSNDLSYSLAIIDSLKSKGFIKENLNIDEKRDTPQKHFSLYNVKFWQDSFTVYLCLSRKLSDHLGYLPIFKQNYSWQLQHFSCKWEHCIEHMPLPELNESGQPIENGCPMFGHFCPGGMEQSDECRIQMEKDEENES